MIARLSHRDRKIAVFGLIAAGAILLFALVVSPWLDHWRDIGDRLAAAQGILAQEGVGATPAQAAKRLATLTTVPAFSPPQAEEQQRLLFQRQVNEQLGKAGVKAKSLQFLSGGKARPELGGRLLRLQCQAKCQWGQLMDLLARLNANPHLVGVEELQLRCNQQNREELDLSLTLTTLTQ
jgi:hypothetical protein